MLSHKKTQTLLFILLFSKVAICHSIENGQSLQGLTGLINVPNAEIIHHGTINFQYSDQIYNQMEYSHNNNLMATLGILPNLEVGGRIAWFNTQSNCYHDTCRLRDLSANIKYKIPFIPNNWFSLALGQHDIGGAANHFQSRFISASKSFNNMRFTLGWGQSLASDNNERLEGAFSGLEYQPVSWLNLLFEDDGQSKSIGTRLNIPKKFFPYGIQTRVLAILQRHDPTDKNKRFFGVSIAIPLGQHRESHAKHPNTSLKIAPPISIQTNRNENNQENKSFSPKLKMFTQPSLHTNYLKSLYSTLKDVGFERLKIGIFPLKTNLHNTQDLALIISLENTVFNHNELDAVNFVIQTIKSKAERPFKTIRIVLKKEDIAIQKFTLQYSERSIKGNKRASIYSSYNTNINPETTWIHVDDGFSQHKPRVVLSPSLSTGVATEFGVFDYSLALEANTTVSLWKGAQFNMTYTQAFTQSDDFLKHHVFYDARQLSAFRNHGLQQTIKFSKQFYSTLFLGLSHYDYYTINNQSTYFTTLGKHKFTLNAGHYKSRYETNISKYSMIASYRYFLPKQDISTTLTVGRFWDEDVGYRLDLLFWFEDKAIQLFYKNTDSPFIGIGLSMPLTPKRAFNKPWGQLKGKSQWRYALQTKVADTTNNVSFKNAKIPTPAHNIDNIYFNHDRLSPLYTQYNQHRLFTE